MVNNKEECTLSIWLMGPALEPSHLLDPTLTNKDVGPSRIRVWCHVLPYLAVKAMKKIAKKHSVKTTNPQIHSLQFSCHSDWHLGWTDISDRLLYLMACPHSIPTASPPSSFHLNKLPSFNGRNITASSHFYRPSTCSHTPSTHTYFLPHQHTLTLTSFHKHNFTTVCRTCITTIIFVTLTFCPSKKASFQLAVLCEYFLTCCC